MTRLSFRKMPFVRTVPLTQGGAPFLREPANYVDTGCSFFDSCLSCPLPKCRYEVTSAESAAMMRRYHRGE